MARKNFRFDGFGFPVMLVNAKVKEVYGEELPDVNYKALGEQLFEAVICKPGRLSGAEVKFLRQHLEMTQEQFAKLLKIERSLVSKWEGKDLKATDMTVHAEVFLRMKLAGFDKALSVEFEDIESAASAKSVGKLLTIRLKAV